jgi:hypothetical protein
MSLEQENIIKELKERMNSLAGIYRHKGEVSCQTDFTFKDYINEKKIAENMAISKVDDILRVPKEFMKMTDMSIYETYEQTTMQRIFDEVAANEAQSNEELKPEEKPMAETQQLPVKKNGFDIKGLFKKFADGFSEIKSPQTLLSFDSSTSLNSNMKLSMDSSSAERAWEKEILGPLRRGVPVRNIQNKFSQLVKAGVKLPFGLRGEFWGMVLQNRCRVTPRMFKALLTRLEVADPAVKEAVKKDMDRTYSELRGSGEYLRLREEATLVLQLFEVGRGLS